MMEKHNGIRPNFQMNVIMVYGKDTMLRQISEAIRIRNANPEKLMNNMEYSNNATSCYRKKLGNCQNVYWGKYLLFTSKYLSVFWE